MVPPRFAGPSIRTGPSMAGRHRTSASIFAPTFDPEAYSLWQEPHVMMCDGGATIEWREHYIVMPMLGVLSKVAPCSRHFRQVKAVCLRPPKRSVVSMEMAAVNHKQNFDYFLVLDFEATCDQNVRLKPQASEALTIYHSTTTVPVYSYTVGLLPQYQY